MKPFRLITVERLRSRALEAKALELHSAAAAQEAAVLERNQMVELLAAGGSTASPLGTWTGADLDLANNFRQVLRQQILDQDERIAFLGLALEQARRDWLTARGELRAVQALHDRHRVAVRAEQARLDQRELDEHAGRRRPGIRSLSDDADLDVDTEVGVR
jgi:flagellar export protein FliJ